MLEQPFNNRLIVSILLIILIIATGAMTVRRAVKGSNDFDTFYRSGQAVLKGDGIYYSGEYHQDVKDIGPFLYPPPAACFFSLLAVIPIGASAFLWNTMNILFFVLILFYIKNLLYFSGDRLRSLLNKNNWIDSCLLIAISLVFLFDNLSMAQMNIFILFLTIVSLHSAQKNNSFLAGFFLACAVWLKLTPVLLFAYYLIKGKWKIMVSFLLTSFLIAILIPAALFGLDKTRIYYRQWFGRMIKPGIITILEKFCHYEPHPLKKSPQEIKMTRLADMLVDKNQALPASLTRLFLKDRNEYAMSTAFPIYSARRYMRLPIILGGLPPDILGGLILALQLTLFSILIGIWKKPGLNSSSFQKIGEMALVFCGMTLFAPFARSHQFISLLFPYSVYALALSYGGINQLRWPVRLSIFLFLIQSVPYGKAAGLGTWANLLLWGIFVYWLNSPRLVNPDFERAAPDFPGK